MGADKRKKPRSQIRFELIFDDGIGFEGGFATNFSQNGLFLLTQTPVPVGTVVKLKPRSNTANFLIEARVVHTVGYNEHAHQRGPGMGLQFTAPLSELAAAALRRSQTLGVYLPPAPKGAGDDRADHECHYETVT